MATKLILCALAVSMAACVGPQTRAAFTIRQAAPPPSAASLRPNQAAKHEANLQHALDISTAVQERMDHLEDCLMDNREVECGGIVKLDHTNPYQE